MTIQEARSELLDLVASFYIEGGAGATADEAAKRHVDALIRACAVCADNFVTAPVVYALERGLPLEQTGFLGMPGDAILSAAGLK